MNSIKIIKYSKIDANFKKPMHNRKFTIFEPSFLRN